MKLKLQQPAEKLLLPPLRACDATKKCLIIDLDETLVHSSFKVMHSFPFYSHFCCIPLVFSSEVYTSNRLFCIAFSPIKSIWHLHKLYLQCVETSILAAFRIIRL